MASLDSSPTPEESQSSDSTNLNEEIPNPQNPNQEIPHPQNPDEEIPNPQNPDEEIPNPQNPDEEITNPQNPDEEITDPEEPELLTLQEMAVHEAQGRLQQEVEAALRQLYGEKGGEWAKEYKMKVGEVQMYAMYADDWAKDDEKDRKPFSFDDDWEFAEDCILFIESRSEGEDDIKTLECFVDYVQKGYRFQENSDDFVFLYGFVISYGECAGLDVLKNKLSKLLSKFLMFDERIRMYPHMVWNQFIDKFLKLGTKVWGEMLKGTLPLLDMPGIGNRNQDNPTIADIRVSGRSHQGRRYRISEDPTSVDEAFGSRPAFNLSRGLGRREAGKPADDQPPEAVADVKGKGKRQAEIEAPNQRPRKYQRVEELLLLFQGGNTEKEDDLILLRYASAYGRNVTSPTVAGLYDFILANLRTGEGISWFRLKLKLTMLEKRYLSVLAKRNPDGYLQHYKTEFDWELHQLGRQLWGNKIDDQDPDGNMGTRGESGSEGVNEGADVGGSHGSNEGAHEVRNEGALEGSGEDAHRVGNAGAHEGGS